MRVPEDRFTQKRYSKTIPVLSFLAGALVLVSGLGVQQAFATHYWSGWWWSNISHDEEMKEIGGHWYVPFYLQYSELDDLPFVGGQDPDSTAESAIEDAADDWNGVSSAWGLTHDDTTSFYWDHAIGTANLAAPTLAVTSTQKHFLDNHLIKATVDINHDTNDVQWDYLDEDTGTSPDTYDLRKVMLHEFGHWVLLCDTYSGGNTGAGDCDDAITTSSIMYLYGFGTAGDHLYTHDEDIVIGAYGG